MEPTTNNNSQQHRKCSCESICDLCSCFKQEQQCTCERPDDNTCDFCDKQMTEQILIEAKDRATRLYDVSENIKDIGIEAHNYCKQYIGDEKYGVAMKAITFGFYLGRKNMFDMQTVLDVLNEYEKKFGLGDIKDFESINIWLKDILTQ